MDWPAGPAAERDRHKTAAGAVSGHGPLMTERARQVVSVGSRRRPILVCGLCCGW
jgi:hypothetical protein